MEWLSKAFDALKLGLEMDIVIYKASNIGQINTWAYNMQPWAWNYLNKHPELLLFE